MRTPSGQHSVKYSIDGINFEELNLSYNNLSLSITNLTAFNNDIYISANNDIYLISSINQLISYKQPNYLLNNQFVYDKPTNISISGTYLSSANLDGKNLTLPTTNLNLSADKNILTLTMKNEYKQYAGFFGGNKNTGIISYNFWIKNTITDNNYRVNTSDTNLYQGLISNLGNTSGANIIQTTDNDSTTSQHSANLTICLQDKLLDLNKSYYVLGTVDKTKNDFNTSGNKVYLNTLSIANNQFTISTDGIYQLHLVDKVGNTNDTYLELGQDNITNGLAGTFNDSDFQQLANKLNVNTDLTTDTTKKTTCYDLITKL